jgi:hypothetical protein
MIDRSHENEPSGGGYGRGILWGFLLVAGVIFFIEHSTHVFQWLAAYGVLLLLLACPLMHLFMHRGGHGGHSGDDRRGEDDRRGQP